MMRSRRSTLSAAVEIGIDNPSAATAKAAARRE
jgi:hypothetical protein